MKLIEILVTSILIIVVILTLTNNVGTLGRTDKVLSIIRAEGVSNIKMTGYKPFVCGREDLFHDGFTGIRNDIPVKGVVCSGILKGSTIRYF